MVAYELIQKLEKLDYFDQLLKGGIVPMNMIDYKVIYEFYMNDLKRLKSDKWAKNIKGQAKSNTAEEFNITERMVWVIVKRMRS